MRGRVIVGCALLGAAGVWACACRHGGHLPPPSQGTAANGRSSPGGGAQPSPAPAAIAPTELTAAQRARDDALRPRAAAFVDAYENGDPLVTRSGKVVFTSNRDGLPRLYVGDSANPGAAPTKLPGLTDRAVAPSLTPDERRLLFLSDVGGDRDFDVLSIGLDGSGLTDHTAGDRMHRDRPIPARAARGVFAFSAHEKKSERTSVYLQNIDKPGAREVYADPRGGTLMDLSADGRRALFARFLADENVEIFDVDTASRVAQHIFPPEGVTGRATAAYSARGDRIYVATQFMEHPAILYAYDRKGQVQEMYQELLLREAAIDDIVVSPTGDRVAVDVDAGNHTEIRLLDASTLYMKRTVPTPLGLVEAKAFTADGTRLTVELSRPDAPPDIFAVDAKSGAAVALRNDVRPGLADAPAMRTTLENIPAFDQRPIPTNLYLPASPAIPANASGKLPTIVRVHGGPTGSATVSWKPDVRFFTSLGWAVVEPNIRGSSGFGVAWEAADDREQRGDALKDIENVNRWARQQTWCDPERIVIMGQSYGGYMTLLALGRQPGIWRAGIDLSGMSDLRTMERLEDQAIRVFDETEFGKLGADDDLLYEWSPLKYVDRITAPVFVYQGVNDPVTPKNEADQIVIALRRRGVPTEYMVEDNEGHGIVRSDNRAEFLARAARFLEEH
jgi:acetyl esterase/lipase